MLQGKKHEHCGKVNWKNEATCDCHAFQYHVKAGDCKRPYHPFPNVEKFTDVTFDHPVMEKFAKEITEIAKRMDMKINIEFHPNFDEIESDDSNFNEIIPAVSIDGWLYVYPEMIATDTITGEKLVDGFALDVEMIEHNYPNEPDYADFDRVIVAQSMYTIIKKVLTMIWEQKYEYVTEAMYYEELTLEDAL